MKLTSTNRPFGLSIELTPRSKADALLTSLVRPINFVLIFRQVFGARLQSAFLLGPGETIRDNLDAAERLRATTRQAPFKFAGDYTARDHPFPSRTRKLSLAGPMVLHG